MSAACALTIARAVKPRIIMAKVVNVDEDGMITGVEPSPQGFLFEFREVEVRDLEGLVQAIAMAARDPHSIVVRGRPKQAVGRRAMYDDADAGPANLTMTPRRWVAFDWDNIPVPHNPDFIEHDQAEFANWARPPALFKPQIGVELALRRLPPAFRSVSCIWQVTASAGFKDGFRLRTWHWLSRALTGSQLKCWLNPAIERGLVDPSTLVEVQPHYVGCTVRGGPDPCPQRFGLLERASHTVAVPEIEGIKMRQERRERERRRSLYAGRPSRSTWLPASAATSNAASTNASPPCVGPGAARAIRPSRARSPAPGRCATATASTGAPCSTSSVEPTKRR